MTQPRAQTVPRLEDAYTAFRPLLFHALSRLTRQGFTASTLDGLDLIHDFFAEEWDSIARRFDPTKGKLESYLYQAFLRFARPRIVRLQRFDRQFEQLSELADVKQDSDRRYDVNELQAVRVATAGLPDDLRRVIDGQFGEEAVSERVLAKRLRISRYHLRQRLVTALGQIVTQLGRPSQIPDADWDVALGLWRDGRTIRETADLLGMTVYRVRQAHHRNAHFLAKGLGGRVRGGTAAMTTHGPGDVLQRAFRSKGDKTALAAIRENAASILKYLEECDEDIDDSAVDREWRADVYAALACAASAESLVRDDAFEPFASEDAQIGIAFRDALTADLPTSLALSEWLKSLPEIPRDDQAELLASPSVQAALLPELESEIRGIVTRGVTPLSVFLGTEAVSTWIRRAIRRGVVSKDIGARLRVVDRELELSPNTLRFAAVIQEVADAIDCDKPVASTLVRWFVSVAERKPFLFKGIEARLDAQGGVCLVPTHEIPELIERWGATVEPTATFGAKSSSPFAHSYERKVHGAISELERNAIAVSKPVNEDVAAGILIACLTTARVPYVVHLSRRLPGKAALKPQFVCGDNEMTVTLRVVDAGTQEQELAQELLESAKAFRNYTRNFFVVLDQGGFQDPIGFQERTTLPSSATLRVLAKSAWAVR